MDHRYGKAKWGPNGTRNRTAPANWRKPIQWNKAAETAGRPALVFCASLADVFEDREDIVEHRRDLFALIDATPNLIWLMLTKRPEAVRRLWPVYHDRQPVFPGCPGPLGEPQACIVKGKQRTNVWLGTSPCNQETADRSVPELLKVRDLCGGTFLSCEPLMGAVDLTRWLCPRCEVTDTSLDHSAKA